MIVCWDLLQNFEKVQEIRNGILFFFDFRIFFLDIFLGVGLKLDFIIDSCLFVIDFKLFGGGFYIGEENIRNK